jgi:hypothetical protein
MALSVPHDVVIRLRIDFRRLFDRSKVIPSTHEVSGESCRKMAKALVPKVCSVHLVNLCAGIPTA